MTSEVDGSEVGGSEGSGWTNDHVREGFDVDGSESRVLPVSMRRRVQAAQARYEVLGEGQHVLGIGGRRLYPLVRRLGALLGRERGAEQWIAESEYLLEQGPAVSRAGVGSRRWWFGLAYLLVAYLLVFGVGIAGSTALLLGLPFVLTTYLGAAPGLARDIRVMVFVVIGVGALGFLGWYLVTLSRAAEA